MALPLDIEAVVAAHLPGYQISTVVELGAGLDNRAYEVNGELIVRVSKEIDPVGRTALLHRESRLLAAVAEVSPLAIPQPVFTAPDQGCLAYVKLRGVPLLDVPSDERLAHATSVAGALADLLTALHGAPADRWADLVETDDYPLTDWRRDAVDAYETVAGQVEPVYRRRVEAFLSAPPPSDRYTAVFSHTDLGIEHVLVDPLLWTVTGVIDWSDAAIADPAIDFGLLYRDLGPAALRAAIRRYRTGATDVGALRERAVFYARCKVFEDLAYGIETGREAYVDKSLAAMGWLFPEASRSR